MAEEKKGFLLYADLIHVVRKMPKDKAGELFLTILEYVNDENPVVTDMLVDIVFEPIKQQFKRDLAKWENKRNTKSEGGVLGNLKRWNNDLYQKVISDDMRLDEALIIAVSRKQSHSDDVRLEPSQRVANIAVNDTVTVTVNDNVNDIIIREGNGTTVPPPATGNSDLGKGKKKSTRTPAPEMPQTSKEVENYMFSKMKNRWDVGFCNLQANKFFDFYKSNGWKQSKGNKIVNWHSAANMWVYREVEKQGPKPFVAPTPVPAAPPPPKPAPVQQTPQQQEQQLMDFTESIYAEYRQGTVKEEGIPANIYELLKYKGLLLLSDADRTRIGDAVSGDKIKAKKKAVAEYFTNIITNGHQCVFDDVTA